MAEEKKEEVRHVPRMDEKYKTTMDVVPTPKEKAKFLVLLKMFNVYSEDNPQPVKVTKSVWLPFNAIRAPGVSPATFADHGISGAWVFSDATDDTIVANLKFPNDMDKTAAPVVQIGWSTNTAVTSETAVWQLEYLYTAMGEDTTAAAQGTLTVNSNAVSQADGLIVAAFAALDVPSSSDVCVHMRLKRLGADGSDDLTDTAELHGLCMSYTSDKLGTAL